MRISKKILAAVLAALMAISMMPLTVFAAPPGSSDSGTGISGGISIVNPTDVTSYSGYVVADGDNGEDLWNKEVYFNDYTWYIIEDNSTSDNAGTVTLFCKDIIGESKFSVDATNNHYSTSTVRTYLDNLTATGSFADVADAIVTIDSLTTNGFQSSEVYDTAENVKLYLLDKTEAENLPFRVRRQSNNAEWWVRSPGGVDPVSPNDPSHAMYVDITGEFGADIGDYVTATWKVRPALKLDLSKVVFDSSSKTFELAPPEPVSYKAASVDATTYEVTFTDATCDDYTVVAADTTTFEDGKWYVVNSNVTVNGRITVNGAANLILADGYTLTVTDGVAVTDPNSLTIYGQENGTGTLTATSTSYGAAGIGGNDDENGPITINGGTVNATSGSAGAGIGGGGMGNGGPVVINGGTVTAIGGEDDGAGIGSGGNGSSCNVTINGGTVNATGRHTYDNTAGIGNSGWSSNGGNIAINGGTVNAACAAGSQGIGGSGCTISITGGTVDVNRGVTDASYGLFGSSFTMSGGEVYVNRFVYVNTTITGGTLIAEANPPFQSDVSIGTGLKVLAGANEESAVEVEPSAINMSSDVYWNSKWIKIYPAPEVKPDGFNLTVEDKVQMNLYINVDDYTDPETATVEVTYNDPEAQTPTLKVDTYSGEALAALKDADDGRYVIPVLAAPAQIRDYVSVTVTDRDEPITTNVATYCETIIAQSEDAELVALANAILDYGKACSAEFDYNVDGFEDQAYYNTEDVSYILDEEAKLNSADANGQFAGYSYIAKAVPALRIYLNTTEAEVVANDLKATVNGSDVEIKTEEGTGYVCVDITGILAEDLHAEYTVEFNGGTLKLNALQYAKAKGGNTDFGRSMCEYWFYAHTYFK